jgi:hypothetical protein
MVGARGYKRLGCLQEASMPTRGFLHLTRRVLFFEEALVMHMMCLPKFKHTMKISPRALD